MATTKGIIDQPLTQKQQLAIEAGKQAAAIAVAVAESGKLVGAADWASQLVNLYKTISDEGYKKMSSV